MKLPERAKNNFAVNITIGDRIYRDQLPVDDFDDCPEGSPRFVVVDHGCTDL